MLAVLEQLNPEQNNWVGTKKSPHRNYMRTIHVISFVLASREWFGKAFPRKTFLIARAIYPINCNLYLVWHNVFAKIYFFVQILWLRSLKNFVGNQRNVKKGITKNLYMGTTSFWWLGASSWCREDWLKAIYRQILAATKSMHLP